jgi:Xaa-Pro aminopeptidase
MNSDTFKNRLKRVCDGLSRSKTDYLIVTKPANVTYITGFSGDDSWVIISPASVTLVTDSRYTEQAADESRLCRIIERKDAMAKTVAGLLRNRRGIRAAIEKSTSLADFEELKRFLTCRPKAVAGIIESVRRAKDKGEIEAVRNAAKIARLAFERAIKGIRPGLTENEVAGLIDFQIRKSGGRNSFDTIVAFGANAARPHHQPTGKKLRRNGAVLIDFGVRHNGYCCDLTRCFTVGKTNRLYARAYAAVERARDAALKMVRAGVEIKRVDAAAKEVIKKEGLPVFGHGTGHGLGLEVHELPTVSAKAQGTLQAGDVITIEPGVYITGRLGVRLEDDFLVTEDGYVELSRVPQW